MNDRFTFEDQPLEACSELEDEEFWEADFDSDLEYEDAAKIPRGIRRWLMRL